MDRRTLVSNRGQVCARRSGSFVRRTMRLILGIVPPVPTAGIPFIAGKIVILAASVRGSLVPSVVSVMSACADVSRLRGHSHDGRVGTCLRDGNSSADESGCCQWMNF
jgi:hypothetical protein